MAEGFRQRDMMQVPPSWQPPARLCQHRKLPHVEPLGPDPAHGLLYDSKKGQPSIKTSILLASFYC